MAKCLSDKEMVEKLLDENQELHQLLLQARVAAAVAIGSFTLNIAKDNEIPTEYAVLSMANKDQEVSRFGLLSDAPDDYLMRSQLFLDVVNHYINVGGCETIFDVIDDVLCWPHDKKVLN